MRPKAAPLPPGAASGNDRRPAGRPNKRHGRPPRMPAASLQAPCKISDRPAWLQSVLSGRSSRSLPLRPLPPRTKHPKSFQPVQSPEITNHAANRLYFYSNDIPSHIPDPLPRQHPGSPLACPCLGTHPRRLLKFGPFAGYEFVHFALWSVESFIGLQIFYFDLLSCQFKNTTGIR
ncbi:hypothetical protein D3C73_1263360 [compost metagenome]